MNAPVPPSGQSPLPPTAPRRMPPRVQQPWHWRLLQIGSAFLPVMLMALLAVGTWWLVKNSFQPGDDRPAQPARHEPDYEMHGFSVQRYTPAGTLQGQLEGKVLRHYPDTDTLEIDAVKLRAIDENGRVSNASARRAITDDDASMVQLLGGAEVIQQATETSAEIRFRSEFLRADLDTQRVYSDQPVVVTQGGTEVRANGMEYTQGDGIVRFIGRSRAVFEPRQKP